MHMCNIHICAYILHICIYVKVKAYYSKQTKNNRNRKKKALGEFLRNKMHILMFFQFWYSVEFIYLWPVTFWAQGIYGRQVIKVYPVMWPTMGTETKLEHIISLWCLCQAILTSWYDMNYYSRCQESSVIDIKNLPRITFSGVGKGCTMVLDRRHVRTEKHRHTALIVSLHGPYLAPKINYK